MKKFLSSISKQEFPVSEMVSAASVRPPIVRLIQQDVPGFDKNSLLSMEELNGYREKYITETLKKEIGELTDLEKTVLRTLSDKTTITDKTNGDNINPTFGQQLADKVASFGGSWTFIISFALFLLAWIMVNIIWLTNKGFDPYPFILLNLILSCLAALQAPVIMMSQNRQEAKDRERSKDNYMINLKSELEIRILHEKIDHMLINQQQELMETQRIQIDMLNDILKNIKNVNHPAKPA